MKTFIRNLTLKKKIQSIVFLCILLLTSVSVFNIRMISVAHQKVLYQTVASSLSFSAKELNNHLDVVSTMADMVLADSTMQKNLGILKDTEQIQERTVAYKAIYGMLNEYYFNFRKNNIRYMSLYQGNFSIHTHIINKEKLPDSIRRDLISRAEAAKGKTILITDYSDQYGLFMVKNIRRTQFLKLDSIGSLIINIDMKQLIDSSTDNSHLYESADYILYDGENLIYQSSAVTDKDPSVVSKIFLSRYGLFQSMGKNYFYVRQALSNYNWDYVCIIPYDNILASLTKSFRFSFFITVIAVIISSILSSALIDSILRHFNNLLLKMKNFADGQKESLNIPYDYAGRTDELGILHTQFDQMVNEVNILIQNGYLNEILRKPS